MLRAYFLFFIFFSPVLLLAQNKKNTINTSIDEYGSTEFHYKKGQLKKTIKYFYLDSTFIVTIYKKNTKSMYCYDSKKVLKHYSTYNYKTQIEEKFYPNGKLLSKGYSINMSITSTRSFVDWDDNIVEFNDTVEPSYDEFPYDYCYHKKWTYYHSNGKIAEIGKYRYGKKVGIWKCYDKNGKLIGKDDYKNGF